MIYGRDLGTVKTFYIDTHTQKNTKPVIQDPNCFVCVMHNKRQAFKNKLIVFLYSTDHKKEVELSLLFNLRGRSASCYCCCCCFLFVLNSLKSLAIKESFFPFNLVILQLITQLPLLCLFAVFPNRSTS